LAACQRTVPRVSRPRVDVAPGGAGASSCGTTPPRPISRTWPTMLTLPSAGELLTSLTLFPLAFLASVELLRRRALAVDRGARRAAPCQLSNNAVQAFLCPVMFGLLLAFRPWRDGPGRRTRSPTDGSGEQEARRHVGLPRGRGRALPGSREGARRWL